MHASCNSTLTFHIYFFLPQGLEFRELLFTKLINAEYACYKAEKFAKLEVSYLFNMLDLFIMLFQVKT